MTNIQFMTKENAITVKDNWTGEYTVVYKPNFAELIANASCEEEVEMLKEAEERYNSGNSLFKGFAFEIVYTSYERALVFDRKTFKQEWKMKWQLMQHPWYRTCDGVYATKEEMIEEIENRPRNNC